MQGRLRRRRLPSAVILVIRIRRYPTLLDRKRTRSGVAFDSARFERTATWGFVSLEDSPATYMGEITGELLVGADL